MLRLLAGSGESERPLPIYRRRSPLVCPLVASLSPLESSGPFKPLSLLLVLALVAGLVPGWEGTYSTGEGEGGLYAGAGQNIDAMPPPGFGVEPSGETPSRSSRAGGGGTDLGTGRAVGGVRATPEPGMYGFLGMVLGAGLHAGSGRPEAAPETAPASALRPSASEVLACEGRSTSPDDIR